MFEGFFKGFRFESHLLLLKSNSSCIIRDINIQCVLFQIRLVEQQILQYDEYPD